MYLSQRPKVRRQEEEGWVSRAFHSRLCNNNNNNFVHIHLYIAFHFVSALHVWLQKERNKQEKRLCFSNRPMTRPISRALPCILLSLPLFFCSVLGFLFPPDGPWLLQHLSGWRGPHLPSVAISRPVPPFHLEETWYHLQTCTSVRHHQMHCASVVQVQSKKLAYMKDIRGRAKTALSVTLCAYK